MHKNIELVLFPNKLPKPSYFCDVIEFPSYLINNWDWEDDAESFAHGAGGADKSFAHGAGGAAESDVVLEINGLCRTKGLVASFEVEEV